MTQRAYGHFSDDDREYILTTPATPRPWINYLSNGDYCAVISHCGGGFSFMVDHRHHGVLRREMRQSSDDLPGRLWYLREGGDFWMLNGHPSSPCESFEARHGFGKTSVHTRHRGIDATLEWFVAPGINGEFCRVTLHNTTDAARSFDLFSSQELICGTFDEDSRERAFARLFLEARGEENGLSFINNRWSVDNTWEGDNRWPHRAYVVSDTAPRGKAADRDAFVGGMSSPLCPRLLQTGGHLGDVTEQAGIDAAAVFEWTLFLAPGESRTLHLLTGVVPRGETPPRVDAAMAAAKDAERAAYWDTLMSTCRIETGDREVDRMVNFWNPYQMMINNWYGRGPSYYHKDQYPAMRDCCQDSYGVLPLIPAETRAKLLRVFAFMYQDGRVGGGCNRVVYAERPADKADLALWMVMATHYYLLETGDRTFLDEPLPYLDGGVGSVREHLLRGVERVVHLRGPHGLPLIANGDWNDAMNRVGHLGRGESVWLAQFLHWILGLALPMLRDGEDDARRNAFTAARADLKARLEACHWDGAWFVRAFDDDGKPVGTHTDREGTIYINSQTWAVISGLGTPEQLAAAMRAVDTHLETDFGLTNLAPAYTRYNPKVGIISQFIPGQKENAAVFSHATAFNLIARAVLGDAESFERIYRKSLPALRDPDLYKAEPYVYSQYCAGPAAPDHGAGAYHWLSGTAAWMYRAVLDYRLGVQPTDKGLRLRPCLSEPIEYRVTRHFRGAVYHLRVRKTDRSPLTPPRLTVDGEAVEGDVIPLSSPGTVCHVDALIS